MLQRLTTLAVFMGAALAWSSAEAGKFNKTLSIADAAPQWQNLQGVDDRQHSLSDYKEAKVVVLVFTCNHCPVATAYQDRLIALQKQYADKTVQVVAINVNTNASDKLDKMKERAQSKGYNFPYLYDPSQKSATSYGASVTPQVFVLDQNRKVAYMGAIDDQMQPDRVQRHYVRDAVEALLAGQQPPVTETRQVGCGIEYLRQ